MAEEFQENLSINVQENVAMGDGIGGGKKEDPAARQKEADMKYLERYVKPHNKPSRLVTEADIPRMLDEAKVMLALCSIPHGYAGGAAAIAHTQIDDKDPLRCFVLKDGFLIVNPVITSHTNAYVDRKEGCMSFPAEDQITVQRFNRITVEFQAVTPSKDDPNKLVLSETREENLSGHVSHVFQHECSHLAGISIYDSIYTPESCLGVPQKKE